MKPFLLDVNVLLALAWPSHVHHRDAQAWFAARQPAGFRTCPITQTGFVRISSNPNFTPRAVSPAAALGLLALITSLAGHEFWPDDLTLGEALRAGVPLLGHRQITAAYLLALAASRGGVVATLDRGMLAVAGGRVDLVELVVAEHPAR